MLLKRTGLRDGIFGTPFVIETTEFPDPDPQHPMQLPPVAVTMIRPVGITVEGLDCWPVELMKVNRLYVGHTQHELPRHRLL